jgi:hypothetical protein
MFAAGSYHGAGDEPFAAMHQLLHEHAVEVVMAGDTHDFQFYKEMDQAPVQSSPMHHFVNGGGGAYLSLGTALDWPKQVPTSDAAFYWRSPIPSHSRNSTTSAKRRLELPTPAP